MQRTKFYCLGFFLFAQVLIYRNAVAQTDTLNLDFKGTENLFLQNNLDLIAQKYKVDSKKALVEQARLWDNPTLSTEQNVHDNTNKFFNHANGNGQVYAALTQIFQTAGERGKQVQLAKDDTQIEQAAFDDLMRNLRYNLLLDFSQLQNLIQQNRIYTGEISSAGNLVAIVEKSYTAGNSSLKDLLRLKALEFGLQNDLIENNRQLNALESELKTLLNLKETVFIKPAEFAPAAPVSLNLPDLIEQAKTNRGDYLQNKYQYDQAGHNINYQKSLSVPDVNIGVDYDRASSYSPNYWGLQVGFALPFFNRNQGNIKAAKIDQQSQENNLKNSENRLRNDVAAAVQQYTLSIQLLSANEQGFYQQYDQLFSNMLNSYKQRQIGLVEFIDFFDSYKDTKLKIIQQQYNLQKAIADLNFSVGTTIINP